MASAPASQGDIPDWVRSGCELAGIDLYPPAEEGARQQQQGQQQGAEGQRQQQQEGQPGQGDAGPQQ